MFSYSSVILAIGMLLLLLAIYQVSHRLARRTTRLSDSTPGISKYFQLSLTLTCALLLMITLYFSVDRYDERVVAMTEEKTSIEKAILSVKHLDKAGIAEIDEIFKEYVTIRIEMSELGIISHRYTLLNVELKALQEKLLITVKGKFESLLVNDEYSSIIAAVSDMIASQHRRGELLSLRLPEAVIGLLVLFCTLLTALYGTSRALITKQRVWLSDYLIISFFCVSVAVILDLEQPRRGFIQIDQSVIFALQEHFTDNEYKSIETNN